MNEDFELNQGELVDAWQSALPVILNTTDHAKVVADEGDSKSVRIQIDTAGRQAYSFDFQCTYKDTREVDVALVDVELDGRSVDEHSNVIQELAGDYIRHIHECAQSLHDVTDPS
ncbi:hypothetical protein [Paenibacillus crassostreae]|uniref:Uncharacterized protein n=1 Tax=Paenibacillus crassostreae TaxID=1763538 RepID=A0A167D443_9BACL|nr:hypothetical protein [Paenibacillus crassostreae]AOZ92777.1 hypothetical protein LPB68_11535 [Paenibacillus crassostreae]OAB73910.1 hypothetical protein PNBC_13240 [Paenibacillus crassostreae]